MLKFNFFIIRIVVIIRIFNKYGVTCKFIKYKIFGTLLCVCKFHLGLYKVRINVFIYKKASVRYGTVPVLPT
jgi:hypothetical protein